MKIKAEHQGAGLRDPGFFPRVTIENSEGKFRVRGLADLTHMIAELTKIRDLGAKKLGSRS